MAANMQDTKFIFRRIELVIGVCGWIFFLHQTLSRRIWFRCKVLLPHSWTHLYQQYQQKWHPCPPSTPACSSGWGPWCAASADRSRSCSPCQNCHKRDVIFVHLFNETQLSNLVFSRQLFLRTIKGPFYRRGQSMDIWCSRFPKQTTLIWNSPDADIYLQDPAIIITVNPKDILDDIYKKRKRQLIVTKLLPPFYSREKEWVFVWKADPFLRIPLQWTTKWYQSK